MIHLSNVFNIFYIKINAYVQEHKNHSNITFYLFSEDKIQKAPYFNRQQFVDLNSMTFYLFLPL